MYFTHCVYFCNFHFNYRRFWGKYCLSRFSLPIYFWKEPVDTVVFISSYRQHFDVEDIDWNPLLGVEINVFPSVYFDMVPTYTIHMSYGVYARQRQWYWAHFALFCLEQRYMPELAFHQISSTHRIWFRWEIQVIFFFGASCGESDCHPNAL